MERLTKLYKQYVGSEPTEIKLMDKAGSNRSYYRLSGEQSVVGVIGESREENDAFVYIARHFKAQGLSVPEVFGVSDDHMAYIQEDLGRKPGQVLRRALHQVGPELFQILFSESHRHHL